MQCRRTANAGVLLELDGVSVLLDGVCRESKPYLGTPEAERQALYACPPDIIAFTHGHFDHFDRGFAQSLYKKTLRPILGPESLIREGLSSEPVTAGNVRVTPIPTRHIGRAGQDTPHVSYLIEGSKRILFTGDAAPTVWKNTEKVDILIAPYAYATTPSSWRISGELADELILLHLPEKSNDPQNLWPAVQAATQAPGPNLSIPVIGETLKFA